MKYTYESPVLIDHGFPPAVAETLESFSIEHATSDSAMTLMEQYRAPVRRSRKETAQLFPVLTYIREHTCNVRFLLKSGYLEKYIPSISEFTACITSGRPYSTSRIAAAVTADSFQGTSARILDLLISVLMLILLPLGVLLRKVQVCLLIHLVLDIFIFEEKKERKIKFS